MPVEVLQCTSPLILSAPPVTFSQSRETLVEGNIYYKLHSSLRRVMSVMLLRKNTSIHPTASCKSLLSQCLVIPVIQTNGLSVTL